MKKKPTPAVSWSTVENLTQRAGTAEAPMVMYFCSEQVGEGAGIGSEAIRERFKNTGKVVKPTVFESSSVLDAFKEAGLTTFCKVLAVKENAELARKYKVTADNTLVFSGPGGEVIAVLAGGDCNQENLLRLLKSWKETYEAWQKKRSEKH